MTTLPVRTAGLPDDDELLTVAEAAKLLKTSERFPRRLIAERRIRFIKVGRFVRIPKSSLRDLIAAGLIEPMTASDIWHGRRAA